VVKIKSHRGVALNEVADQDAREAALSGADPFSDIPLLFTNCEAPTSFTYSWWAHPTDEAITKTTDWRCASRRMTLQSADQAMATARAKETWASAFLLNDTFQLHLLRDSQLHRAWTPSEQRRWMQLVSRTFPTNSYLQRIGAHATGQCPWCAGTRESLTHFQSQCPQFRTQRTAAHHDIVRATISALKDLQPRDWEFFYETPFNQLPFPLQWQDAQEEAREHHRRPDCVAYNRNQRRAFILEFTRAMDNPQTMAAALDAKTLQYATAAEACRRARDSSKQNAVAEVDIIPFIFGVRGAMLVPHCQPFFRHLGLSPAQTRKVLAAGVRAAIAGAHSLCAARIAETPPRST
jgi:hypothetical protein